VHFPPPSRAKGPNTIFVMVDRRSFFLFAFIWKSDFLHVPSPTKEGRRVFFPLQTLIEALSFPPFFPELTFFCS